MRLNKKYSLLTYILSTVLILMINSCVNEKIDLPDNTITDNPAENASYSLKFKINLSSMSGNTRAGTFEDFEDYINPQNIRVLFFYGNENDKKNYDTLIKQFKINGEENDGIELIPITSGESFSKEWYINLPITSELEEFAQTLRDNPFKIAVLANWPTDTPDILEGENIDRLHHLEKISEDKYNGEETYSFLFDSNYPEYGLGKQKGWVTDVYNKGKAEDFIRNDFGPLTTNNPSPNLKSKYGDLWLLWNFDGALDGDSKKYNLENFADNWATKNNYELGSWLNEGKTSKLYDFKAQDSNGNYYDAGHFEFIAGKEETSIVEMYNKKNGILLSSAKLDIKNNDIHDVIKIKLPNSGYHRITWSPKISTSNLQIEYRNNSDDNEAKKTITLTSGGIWESDTYKITGEAEYMYVYSATGNAMIYEIEHIADEYLAGIAREGNKPNSTDQTIPMYGIQKFEALKNPAQNWQWEPGSSFDLSGFNNLPTGYVQKDIPLLRSVAKIELKIPKSIGSHHVYLRSANRYSRCEPMDVSTPTSELWLDDQDGDHNRECEFFNLIGHEPFYTKSTSENQYNNYQSKLAWWFGSWSKDGKTIGIVDIKSDSERAFPKIINPLISRSDFIEFNENNSDTYYDRYILYVPEKFVDDPGSIGKDKNMETTAPKVCHIEFRKADDPYTNVDDDQCYRIYFIDGGYNEKYKPDFSKTSDGKYVNNWERVYEQNVENLKQHWPIIRNHVYSFTVTDIQDNVVVTKLEVLPWRMVEDNSYNW